MTPEQFFRAREQAIGQPREVIMAALYMRGTEEDAEFLADVRARTEAWELAQDKAAMQRKPPTA